MLLALASLLAWSAPQGLAPVGAGLIAGRTLRPASLGIEVDAPGEGWSWYAPQAADGKGHVFVCAPGDDRFRIVVMAGGSSGPEQFLEVMKRLEGELRQAWERHGASLEGFTYKEPADFPGALRYLARARSSEFVQPVFGYVLLGSPTVTVQAISIAEQEPGELLEVARSVRRPAGAATLTGRGASRLIQTAETLLGLLIAAFVWRQVRKKRKPPSGFLRP